MLEGMVVTLEGWASEPLVLRHHQIEPSPASFNARVSFKWQSSIFVLEETRWLEEWIRQLLTIPPMRGVSEADPFEVFDLRPLATYHFIGKVQKVEYAPFQFVTDEEETPEADPFEVFDLRPLATYRVTGKVRKVEYDPFDFATDEGEEG